MIITIIFICGKTTTITNTPIVHLVSDIFTSLRLSLTVFIVSGVLGAYFRNRGFFSPQSLSISVSTFFILFPFVIFIYLSRVVHSVLSGVRAVSSGIVWDRSKHRSAFGFFSVNLCFVIVEARQEGKARRMEGTKERRTGRKWLLY